MRYTLLASFARRRLDEGAARITLRPQQEIDF
jgi:hypothetical protein